MSHPDLLNFEIANHLTFTQQGDLTIAHISSEYGQLRVALQGAQVLDWLPVNQTKPVIWVSDAAVYQTGKGVRGGVPVCWPWFGAAEGLPAHGFVRTKSWSVEASGQQDRAIWLRLTIEDDEASRALWPHAFKLSLTVTMGESLDIVLQTENKGSEAFPITEALHTYFTVGDVEKAAVTGLSDCTYLDKVQGMQAFTQAGDVTIAGEVDRVYINTRTDTSIIDPVLGRDIIIRKQNSTATVVWNPGAEKEKGFADMRSGDYKYMLCVESGTAGGDQVMVAPGEQHALMVQYAVKAH